MRFILLLFTLLFSQEGFAITEGIKVQDNHLLAKSVVSWTYQQQTFCSGVIISQDHILTAAHCVAGGLDEVSFGVQTINAKFIPVEKVWIHPDFERARMDMPLPNGLVNDLAVLKLKSSIPKGYHPLNIYRGLTKAGNIHLLGFGKESSVGKMGTLRIKNVNINDYLVESGEWVTSKAACGGDSGGPLVYINKAEVLLIGITSRPDKRLSVSPCGGASVQTDLVHQLWWLEKFLL